MKGKMGRSMQCIEYSPETLERIEYANAIKARQPGGICEITIKDKEGNIIKHEFVKTKPTPLEFESTRGNKRRRHKRKRNRHKNKKQYKKHSSETKARCKLHPKAKNEYLIQFSESTKQFIEDCLETGLTNPYHSCMAVIDKNMSKNRLEILEEWEKLNNRKDSLVRMMLSENHAVEEEIFDVCYEIKYSRIQN